MIVSDELRRLLTEDKIDKDELDGLIHEHFAAKAAEANNMGGLGQLAFLLEAGYTEEELRARLEVK
jgi:hypothetical protein